MGFVVEFNLRIFLTNWIFKVSCNPQSVKNTYLSNIHHEKRGVVQIGTIFQYSFGDYDSLDTYMGSISFV